MYNAHLKRQCVKTRIKQRTRHWLTPRHVCLCSEESFGCSHRKCTVCTWRFIFPQGIWRWGIVLRITVIKLKKRYRLASSSSLKFWYQDSKRITIYSHVKDDMATFYWCIFWGHPTSGSLVVFVETASSLVTFKTYQNSIFFFLFCNVYFNLLIYLAALYLNCSTWGLASVLQFMGSLVVACRT